MSDFEKTFQRVLQAKKIKAEGRDHLGRFQKKERELTLSDTDAGAAQFTGRPKAELLTDNPVRGSYKLREYRGTAGRHRGRKGFSRGRGFKIS